MKNISTEIHGDYAIVIRPCDASRKDGGRFRRPVNIYVINLTMCGGAVPERISWSSIYFVKLYDNVDSRFRGPRSAYGKAMTDAKSVIDALTLMKQANNDAYEARQNALRYEDGLFAFVDDRRY